MVIVDFILTSVKCNSLADAESLVRNQAFFMGSWRMVNVFFSGDK